MPLVNTSDNNYTCELLVKFFYGLSLPLPDFILTIYYGWTLASLLGQQKKPVVLSLISKLEVYIAGS